MAKRGRPRKDRDESTALVLAGGQEGSVVEAQAVVVRQSREDRREAARELRKREALRRKAERAAMAIHLINRVADQIERSDNQGTLEERRGKTAKAARAKAEAKSLEVFDELVSKMKEDLW